MKLRRLTMSQSADSLVRKPPRRSVRIGGQGTPPSELGRTLAPLRFRGQAAFTMVEIALALAVIGFALVAIIGILPMGMSVQKENRQETIINQDALYLMDAIRSGARGIDELTNYVDAITNVVTRYDANGNPLAGYPTAFGFTANYPPGFELTNGARIIGLLSTPKYVPIPYVPSGRVPFTSNHVTAYMRALSGAATEKPPQDNADVRDLAFSYRMISEVIPFSNYDTNWITTNAPALTPADISNRSNYWSYAGNLQENLHELRLIFRWPLLPNGDVGNGRQVYRTMVSGFVTNQGPFYFFESRSYARAP